MSSSRNYSVIPQTPTMFQSPGFPQTSTRELQKMVEESGPFGLSLEHVEKANKKLKDTIRILRLVSRFAATALAAATLSLEAQTIYEYSTTHLIQRGGRGPWARQTALWPSIMMLAASGVTVVIGIMIMGAYIRSIQAANKLSLFGTVFSISVEVIHISAWITVAVLYRKGKTGHDLWGWACSPLAEKIKPNFQGIVNFGAVCRRGSTNLALSIANPSITIFNLSIWYFVFQRRKYQKLQEKLVEEHL